MLQNLVVALIVIACAVYAAWSLMPASWRRGLAAHGAKAPGPARLRAWFTRRAVSAPGCGCDGCDAGAPKAPGGAQPVRIVRKPR